MKKLNLATLFIVMVFFMGCSPSDDSQTVEQAQGDGLPSLTRTWKLPEQRQFLLYLNKLPSTVSLPTNDSPKSGKIFKKFILSVNNKLNKNEIEEFIKFKQLTDLCYEVLKAYTLRHNKSQKYSLELAYLYGTQLQTSFYMQNSAKNLLETTMKNTEKYSQRQEGVRLIQKASLININISLKLFEQGYFSKNKVLPNYFVIYVPQLLSLFDHKTNLALKKQFKEISQSNIGDSAKDSIKKVLAKCPSRF